MYTIKTSYDCKGKKWIAEATHSTRTGYGASFIRWGYTKEDALAMAQMFAETLDETFLAHGWN